MNNRYRILFCGDVVNGSNVSEVKKKLASLLQEDHENIEKLFSGQTFVIKKNVDLATCEKIQKSFFSVGAVCHIKNPFADTIGKTGNSAEEPLQAVDSYGSPVTVEEAKSQKNWKEFMARLITLPGNSKQSLRSSKEKASKLWDEATESMQSDMEIGGIKLLVKNKSFLKISISSILLISLFLFAVTYERKAMPLTSENFDIILAHIEFIENAFTMEELETMTKNRSDFLDYVLVDPIKKLGYEFEASIENISENFLDDDFEKEELNKVKVYLGIATHEREELLKNGIITKNIKKKLDAVAKKMGK